MAKGSNLRPLPSRVIENQGVLDCFAEKEGVVEKAKVMKEEIAEVEESISLPKSLSDTAPPQAAGASVSGAAIGGSIEQIKTHVGNYRWFICALHIFAATINYLDQKVITTLKDELQRAHVWDEIDYSWVVFAFQTAYAIGLLAAGRVMDRLGTRKGFSLSVFFWSVAAMGHALVSTVIGFSMARFALGLGESGNFPASIKTVAEWFPRKERALATGIFNSGTNVGALATPLAVPWITLHWGWKWAFIATGLIGFLWVVWWLAVYRAPEQHLRLSANELAYIRSDAPERLTPILWRKLILHRQTWAFA